MAEKSKPSAGERDRQPTPPASTEETERSSETQSGPSKPATEDVSPRDSPRGDQSGGSRTSRARQEHVSLKGIGSLERLRDRVETAAHELKRLRDENETLSERVKELESRPEVEAQGTFLSLDHDPELLRRKISGFIEAIDRYLENERKRS